MKDLCRRVTHAIATMACVPAVMVGFSLGTLTSAQAAASNPLTATASHAQVVSDDTLNQVTGGVNNYYGYLGTYYASQAASLGAYGQYASSSSYYGQAQNYAYYAYLYFSYAK